MNALIGFLTENCCGGVAECGPAPAPRNLPHARRRRRCPHEQRSIGLPVAVIGGGPVGLAAASHLVTRGLPVKLYEAGETVAAHVRDWGHVRLFSPWGFNTDAAATAILREHGWQAPPATRCRLAVICIRPISSRLPKRPRLENVIETGARVRNVPRAGIDKVVSRERGDHPFALAINAADGGVAHRSSPRSDRRFGHVVHTKPARRLRRAGCGRNQHSPTGSPTASRTCSAAIARRYAGRRVLVIGGGHSAANVAARSGAARRNGCATQITWAVRAGNLGARVRRRRGRPAAGAWQARQRSQAAGRKRPAANSLLSFARRAQSKQRGDGLTVIATQSGRARSGRSTASWLRPGSAPTSP